MLGDDIEEYYRARAPEYEQIYYRDDPLRRAEIDTEAVRLAELAAGRTVLELACGTGYWTQVMSRTAKSIIASDIAAETLIEARKKEYHCPVEFKTEDMFAVSYDEGAFDLVALGFWFSHQPRQEYERLFQILTRPLRSDGLIWMIDNNPPAEGSAVDPHLDEHGNNYKQRNLSDGRSFLIVKNYFGGEELADIFGRRFGVRSLIHNRYYWSVVLANPRA
jgi:ubiquinone/menaquinone biosynthesis C-methylase UbiE